MKRCPRDQEILASNDVHGYRYYSCEKCHGHWLLGESLRRVLSERGLSDLQSLPVADAKGCLCPDCLQDCAQIVVDGCSLNVCDRCKGVWLDPGEVMRLRRLFPGDSAVIDAESSRKNTKYDVAGGVGSLFELVANLLVLLGK